PVPPKRRRRRLPAAQKGHLISRGRPPHQPEPVLLLLLTRPLRAPSSVVFHFSPFACLVCVRGYYSRPASSSWGWLSESLHPPAPLLGPSRRPSLGLLNPYCLPPPLDSSPCAAAAYYSGLPASFARHLGPSPRAAGGSLTVVVAYGEGPFTQPHNHHHATEE
ncbi:uncharacterized protein BDR25DRAFT_45698, partial [Lindgomyces ingoldianus]